MSGLKLFHGYYQFRPISFHSLTIYLPISLVDWHLCPRVATTRPPPVLTERYTRSVRVTCVAGTWAGTVHAMCTGARWPGRLPCACGHLMTRPPVSRTCHHWEGEHSPGRMSDIIPEECYVAPIWRGSWLDWTCRLWQTCQAVQSRNCAFGDYCLQSSLSLLLSLELSTIMSGVTISRHVKAFTCFSIIIGRQSG